MFFCCPGLLKAHFVRWLFDRLFRTNERVKTGNNHTSPNPLQAGTDVSQLKNMRYVFMPAPKLTSILINHEQWYWSCKSSFLNMIAQASKAHVTSVLHKFTISQEIRCCITSNHWDFVWEIKYWGLQMLNIIIIFTFFLQNKKGRLTFYVFLCFLVWIHQFNWIFLLLLYDPMSLSSWYEVKAAQKNSQRSGPCLLKGGLRPENPSNRSFFSTRGKLLSPLHCSNSPTFVAGNEYFLLPCPKYIRSPDAVISRVDTALVWGQISFDQGIICFERNH